MAKIRTFIAIKVAPAVVERASELIKRLRTAEADVNWVEPHNLHLTLKFLGDVPDVEVPDVCRVVERIAAQHTPFELAFAGAGAFPDAARPRTLWMGVQRGAEAATAVQQDLEDEMANLRFPRERRRFHPHLTLGRLRHGGPAQRTLSALVQENEGFDGAAMEVDELLTVASFLDKKTGPTYDVLATSPLEEP